MPIAMSLERPALQAVLGESWRFIAKSFATWLEYRSLLRLAPPLVAERPDSVFSGLGGEEFPGMTGEEIETMLSGRFVMRPVDISSTKVRKLIAAGAGNTELLGYLTEPILRFIRERGLYGSWGGAQ